jgi:hypothetical protein
MGAFFLNKKTADIDMAAVEECFAEKGFKKQLVRDFGSYDLRLFKKTLVDTDNFLETENGSIYAVGTVVYKSLDYQDSLRALLHDFLAGRLDVAELIGSFVLMFRRDRRYYFLTDLAGHQNIFYDREKSVISSSFLAALYSAKERLHLNKFAVTEILTTGNLIGPDTCVIEVERFLVGAPQEFDGLELLKTPESSLPASPPQTYTQCLSEQIEILNGYFRTIKGLADRVGVSSGLTGGLDSRLLMALILRHLENCQFFTTWQKTKSLDFLLTERVARAAGQRLTILPVTEPLEMSPEQAMATLRRSFFFFDGLVRTHHLWTEEINTRSYRERLLGDRRLGFSGVGGEQYRNQERMLHSKWGIRKWVEYDLVYKHSGDCFHSKKRKGEFLEFLEAKIRKRLGLRHDTHVDHFLVKRYFNEIYNPANRTVRMNIENQIAFFLCPYTEFRVSRQAYKAVPHLGAFLTFEADMIKTLSPRLAAIETHNGFPLTKGDPVAAILAAHGKELLPKGLFYRIYRSRKRPSSFYADYTGKFEFAAANAELIKALDLPVDINKIMSNAFLSPLVISLGYFLASLKGKLGL